MSATEFSLDTNRQKILFAGNPADTFLDVENINRLPCEVHTNVLDAIDAAGQDKFAAIAVVLSDRWAGLTSALKALRQVSADTRIVLLSKMYEEPLAIKLVGSLADGRMLADDYLIYPLRSENFYQYVTRGLSRGCQAGATEADADLTGKRIKQLEKLATEDDLTGLKNRRYIWEFCRQIIEYARKENRRVTLLLFDIDNFKHYNDVYGHSTGDTILKQAAVLMQHCCRKHDVVGRIGGDEFAAVFWDDPRPEKASRGSERRSATADHPEEAISVAKRFRKAMERTELPLLGPDGRGVLTISGGLASFDRDGSTVEELFEQADQALLEAKRSGKNRIYLVGKPESDIDDIQ